MNAETVFTLPAPFLRDSAEEGTFGDVRCELAAADEPDTWRLTYTPDAVWVASARFPVVLDPVVITKKHSSAIEDNFVTSAKPNTVQPYADTGMTISNSSGNWGTSIAYIKFLNAGLPSIDSSYYVTKAYFSVMTKSKPTTAAAIYLKEVLGSWNSQTITYNNAPALNSKVLDYAYMTGGDAWYTYDISNLVRKWYGGGTNNGFALEAASNTYLELYTSDHKYNKPYVVINYISLAGTADYLAYEDQAVGRAGTGHVSLYNGNVIFERQATSCSGSRMPVSVSQVYNSCYRNETAFCMGAGWKTNVQQALYRETLTDPDGSTLYYVYLNASGTKIHFKQVSGAWKDQSGMDMTLTISGSTATITDKENNTLVFDLPTVEFADNYANAKMLKSMSDACGNKAAFVSSGNVVLSATDGVGRYTEFSNSFGRTRNGSRNDNLIGTIFSPAYPDIGACGFTYDANERMLDVWEPADDVIMVYTYDANGLLTSATNCDGVKVTYEYYTNREPYRVKRARVLNGSLVGFDHTYVYSDCLTVVTDNLGGKKLFYHFNDYGNCVSVNDQLGYALFAKYSTDYPVNHPEAVSHMQKSIVNLLPNHNFDSDSGWSFTNSSSAAGNTIGYSTDSPYMGKRCVKATVVNGGRCDIQQWVMLERGKTYTASFYAKCTGNMRVWLETYTADEGWTVFEKPPIQTASAYRRYMNSFTVPGTGGMCNVYIGIRMGSGNGTAWVDCVQVEEGPVANSYNLLINGDFTFNVDAAPEGWRSNSTNTAADKVYPTCTGVKPQGLSANTMRLYGTGRSTFPGIFQDIALSGSQGDVYVAGGWSLGYSKPRKGENFRYDIRVSFLKAGTTSTRVNAPSIEWTEEWTDWQFAAGPVVAPCDYTSVRLNVDYERNINYAEFGGIFLYKEQFGQSFVYDSKGNVLSSTDAAGLKGGATYDGFNNVLTYWQTGRPSTVKTTLEWGGTDAEKKKHLLRKSTSPLGTVNEYTYDAYGNQLTAKTSKSGAAAFLQTGTAYDDKANHVASRTDARGKKVTQAVNPSLDTLTSVTDPQGQTVNYTYDLSRKITQTAATTPNGTYRNNYAYDMDMLTQVKHNTSASAADDVTYHFAYDALERPTTVKIGTKTLSTTAYNPDATVAGVSYGNGDKVTNTYDAFKRLIGVKFDGETRDRFIYTYGANGAVAQVVDDLFDITVRSEYDAANRPMRKTTLHGANHAYTGEVTYDQYNNLAAFKEQVGSDYVPYTTTFTYDSENRPTVLNYGGSRQTTYTYDGLGRITKRTVSAGNATQTSNYTYVAGGFGANSTSPLVQTISQPTGNLSYAYDANGNITSVSDGSKTVTYAYDKIGQLTRVNDPYDTMAGSVGTTWVYSYDLGGNIQSKKAYAYTTGTLGSAVKTIPYVYGDANWKDKLTGYNGTGITYDAIGNPLKDGKWDYSWVQGRQLRSMYKGEFGEAGYDELTFEYNADGLRTKKERMYLDAGGSIAYQGIDYTLHGKDIVHLADNEHEMHFYYDAQNKPAVALYDGVAYAYMYNLQGDVIALVNASGTPVVRYTYDAWGKPLSKTGTLATTLGTLNPFRYRGYVYDEETGLYYLRSRYYNPTWGRFVNADVYKGQVSQLMSHNTFAYCINDPVVNADSSGYIAASCFDENGNISTVMSVVMGGGAGGGGGTIGGYVVLDTVCHMDKEDWINEAVNVATTALSFIILKGAHGMGLAFRAEALSYFSSKVIGNALYGITVANGLGVSYLVKGVLQNAAGKEAAPVSRIDFVKDFAAEFIPIKTPVWVELLGAYLEEAIDWSELLPGGK